MKKPKPQTPRANEVWEHKSFDWEASILSCNGELVKYVYRDSERNMIPCETSVELFFCSYEPKIGMTPKQARAVVRLFRRYWTNPTTRDNRVVLLGVLAVLPRGAVRQLLRHARIPFPPGL